MSAGIYDIVIDQGSDFKLTLVIKDGNAVRNLTGYQARGHLRKNYSISEHFVFDFSDSTYDSNGTVIMKLPHNVTSSQGNALAADNYVYDVEIFKPDGNDAGTDDDEVERILQGKAEVTRESTR